MIAGWVFRRRLVCRVRIGAMCGGFAGLLIATSAESQSLRMSWNSCDPQIANMQYTGPGPYKLILSATGISQTLVGHGCEVCLGPNVQDAWRFEDTGCQGGMLSLSSSAFSKACPALRGNSPLAITAFSYDVERGTASIRMAVVFDSLVTNPSTRYTLWQVTFDHSHSVSGADGDSSTCDNAAEGLVFNASAELLGNDGLPYYLTMDSTDAAVTWNGGAQVSNNCSETGEEMAVGAVSPRVLHSGEAESLVITGDRLSAASMISLAQDGTAPVLGIAVPSTVDSVQAAVHVPTNATGIYDLIVSDNNGQSDTLMAGIRVEAATTNKPVILRVSTDGTFATVAQGADGYDAELGEWDGPCYSPEPNEVEQLIATVDVRDGGAVSFDYRTDSNDIVHFDPFQVRLWDDVTGEHILMDVGTGRDLSWICWPWSTAWMSSVIDLTPYAHRTIELAFQQYQDGHGEQTRTEIRGLGVRDCPVLPLKPLVSGLGLAEESGTVDTNDMRDSTKTAMNCFIAAVHGAGGDITITSGYRPPDYQDHLREVYTKHDELMQSNDPSCDQLRSAINAEFGKHGLDASSTKPATGARGKHSKGVAFDAKVSGISKSSAAALAATCGLLKPVKGDPVHYVLAPYAWIKF
jgi:hypothetical protein